MTLRNMHKFSSGDNSSLVKVGDTRFIPEKFGTLESKEYRVIHRDPKTVLDYLKMTAVRYRSNYDLGLYDKFWIYGYLVSSKSLRDLAEAFGYKSVTHIRRIIKTLIKSKEVYVAKVNVGKNKPQNVYVVGIHNGRINSNFEELYFTEIEYNKNLNSKNIDYYLSLWGIRKDIIDWNVSAQYVH